jgi:hypothetical protein
MSTRPRSAPASRAPTTCLRADVGTLHVVTNPAALPAALDAMAPGDELALMHRAAACDVRDATAQGHVHVVAGPDAAAALLELVLRHARSVTWR